jgi:processive 1,2-diacylglycerol beta-glucosyltransferase
VRAAEALEEAARAEHPGGDFLHVDVLELTHRAYRRAYTSSYLKLADDAPNLWGLIFRSSDRKKAFRRNAAAVRAFDRIEFSRFYSRVDDFRPDHVICTHFLPVMVLGDRKAPAPFSVNLVVTDYYAHGYWSQLSADRVFVGGPEMIEELADTGLARERIHLSGIPVSGNFSGEPDRAAIRQKLDLSPDLPVVLLMSGGWGAGGLPEIAKAVFAAGPAQVIAVAGRNEGMKAALDGLEVPAGSKLIPFGFVDFVHELMAVSDICVSKSGGLTTSECLAMGLPMIVPNPMPGQEELNADHLAERGAGLKARSPGALRLKLKELLADGEKREAMKRAARSLGRPDAARTIIRTVCDSG